MRNNKVIQTMAVVVTVSAVAAMAFIGARDLGPGSTPSCTGLSAGNWPGRPLSLLKPGGQIMVLTRDTASFPSPATDVLVEGFQRELRKSHVSISTEQKLEVDALRRMEVPRAISKAGFIMRRRGRDRFVPWAASVVRGATAAIGRNQAGDRGLLSRQLAGAG